MALLALAGHGRPGRSQANPINCNVNFDPNLHQPYLFSLNPVLPKSSSDLRRVGRHQNHTYISPENEKNVLCFSQRFHTCVCVCTCAHLAGPVHSGVILGIKRHHLPAICMRSYQWAGFRSGRIYRRVLHGRGIRSPLRGAHKQARASWAVQARPLFLGPTGGSGALFLHFGGRMANPGKGPPFRFQEKRPGRIIGPSPHFPNPLRVIT